MHMLLNVLTLALKSRDSSLNRGLFHHSGTRYLGFNGRKLLTSDT